MTRPLFSPLPALAFACALACHVASAAAAERITISGRVVDEHGAAVPNIDVRGLAYTDAAQAKTDGDGRFTIDMPAERIRQLAIVADDPAGNRMGTFRADWDAPPDADSDIQITLRPCRSLPVQVKDAQGKPAPNATVGALIHYAPLATATTDDAGRATLRVPADAELQALYAGQEGVGFDYRVVSTPRDPAHRADWLANGPIDFQLAAAQTVRIRLVSATDQPLPGLEIYLWLLNKPAEPDSFNLSFTPGLFRATTDQDGVAEFQGVPAWDVHPLTFWPSADDYVHQRITFDPEEHPDGQLTVALDRLVSVSGRVEFDDGRPAPGVTVAAQGVGYVLDGFRKETTTNDDGEFDLPVAPNQLYMFVIKDSQWAAPALDGIVIRPEQPVEGLAFRLRRSTRVHGQVTVGPEQKPVAGQRMTLTQSGRPLNELEGVTLPNPDGSRTWIQPTIASLSTTDDEGRFEFFVGPGVYALGGPSQSPSERFEIAAETEREINFAAPRPETGPFSGLVVAGDSPQPVAGALVDGQYRSFHGGALRFRTDEHGAFAGERSLHRTVLMAKSPAGDMAGIVEIGPDDETVTIPIAPLASATARLVDDQAGDPLPDTQVQWGRRVPAGDDDAPWMTVWGGSELTDNEGRFALKDLVVGQKYDISIPRGDGSYGTLPAFTPQSAEHAELGDLRLPGPYVPPTFEELVEREFAAGSPPLARYENALAEAERLRQNVLTVFLKRGDALTESWFRQRLEDARVRAELPNYQLLQIDGNAAGAAALAELLGVEIDAAALPLWRFGDAAGNELGKGAVPRLPDDGGLDQPALLELLARHAPALLDARDLLEEALADAARSNRRVIVQETATWCGPCHLLSRYLERFRSTWERDFLWVRIDQRWTGSDEVMDGIQAGKRGGIPWFAILDADANVLATSDGPEGNIGYPSDADGIAHFMSMLEATRQRLSDDDLAAMRADLEGK